MMTISEAAAKKLIEALTAENEELRKKVKELEFILRSRRLIP